MGQKITEEKAVRRRNRWSHRQKRRGRPAFRHRSISEDQAINPSTSELEESREEELSEKQDASEPDKVQKKVKVLNQLSDSESKAASEECLPKLIKKHVSGKKRRRRT